MNSAYSHNKRDHYNGLSFIKSCWILLAAGFFLGMSYLWLYSHIVDISNTIEMFERKMSHLRDRSISLESRLEYLQSPSVITSRLEEFQIALVDPYPEQLVRVHKAESINPRKEPRPLPPQDIILSIAR